MNNFELDNRLRDRGINGSEGGIGGGGGGGGGRGRRGGRGDMNFMGYGNKDNEMSSNQQSFRTRKPRGVSNFERNDRSFRNPRADFGFEAPQFRSYENQAPPREGFFEGRGRGWGRGGQRYPRGGGGGGGGNGGYIRNRNPQESYYNGANRPLDVGVGYTPNNEGGGGRRRRRQSEGGGQRYGYNNEQGYDRQRFNNNPMRYRGGGRGRGQMRNNNNNNNFEQGSYYNRGGQGRRMNRRYPFNSGRRGQRRGQRGGNQRGGRQEEKKVPFLNEIVHIESAPDVKSDVDDDKKEKPETTIPNAGQYTLHYWDAPTIDNLPPLEQ